MTFNRYFITQVAGSGNEHYISMTLILVNMMLTTYIGSYLAQLSHDMHKYCRYKMLLAMAA